MDLTFQVPTQYCSLQHQILLLSPVSYNWVLFLLWLNPFILSGVISPLISSSIFGPLLTWEVHLSVSYLFAFSNCSWGSQGKNTEVFCIPVPYGENDIILLLLLSFQYHICLPFHTVHGVLKTRILKWIPFPSPVDHILSDLSTMTWVALHGMA